MSKMNNVIDKKGEQLTFIQLFTRYNYRIEIPIIQRDYAQGRKTTEEIRNTFLNSLKEKLESNENIDLDFVYGSINSENKFIPLDGQQRLTTLFLLHWYLAYTSNKIEDFRNIIQENDKSKFTYETRISSREFCDALLNNDFDVESWKQRTLSDIIKDASWFYYSWEQDPTIKGMLIMLDAIQVKFGDIQLYETLKIEENPIVTFQFLNLKEYNLTDDLYIKMNARGKPLTEFENFKAKFENFIEENHSKELSDEFANKIDGIWCDLFWDYSVIKNDDSIVGIKSLVDKPLLNFIKYIAEMLHYENTNDGLVYNFIEMERIFKLEANLKFLFNAFDLFVNNKNSDFQTHIGEFFNQVFSYHYVEGKVALFDKKINLFENCIYDTNFDHKEKLMFYALLYYQIKSKEPLTLDITDNLKDYLRIIRNYILRINQIKKDDFTSELRTSQYKNIISAIHIIYDSENVYQSLITKTDLFDFRTDNIKFEIDKANFIFDDIALKKQVHRLEDHHYFKGSIHNLDFIYNEKAETEKIVDIVYNIWGVINDSLITRSLLSFGDYSIYIGNSSLGNLYFFGKGNKWYRILASIGSNERLKPILKEYLLTLVSLDAPDTTTKEKLKSLIDAGLQKDSLDPWIYYFIKYSKITSNDWNIYAFTEYDEIGFSIEYINGTSIRSNHIDVLNKAVIESKEIAQNKVHNWSWVNNFYQEPIYFKNGIKLYADNNFWRIKIPKDLKLSEEIVKLFLVNEHINEYDQSVIFYEIHPNDSSDLVEVAIQFINSL